MYQLRARPVIDAPRSDPRPLFLAGMSLGVWVAVPMFAAALFFERRNMRNYFRG